MVTIPHSVEQAISEKVDGLIEYEAATTEAHAKGLPMACCTGCDFSESPDNGTCRKCISSNADDAAHWAQLYSAYTPRRRH